MSRRLLCLHCVLILTLAACGGTGGSQAEPAAQPEQSSGDETAAAEPAEPAPPVDPQAAFIESLPNALHPDEGIYTGGQPTDETLDLAQGVGIRTVINLRGPMEMPFDERAAVEERGMNYVWIQVAAAQGLTQENAKKLDDALQGEGPFLVHCGSGNRAGALFALRAAWLQEMEPEAAIEVGKAHGLTRYEEKVRQRLK